MVKVTGISVDGDQMNVCIYSSVQSRNEVAELSSVKNWLISHTTSTPSIGQVDDGIIGTAELTRSGVYFDKYHAMLLFQDCTILPDFSEVPTQGFSGRDCISMLLIDTPVNFNRVPEFYKQNMAAYLKYDPTETRVKIVRGKHISGVLDKKSIGKGQSGGLYHIVANEYGEESALDLIYNMQQLATGYIYQFGYTIGINDLLIPLDSKVEIDKIAADIINKSRLITEQLHNGEIIPPIGQTVEEFYEKQQIDTLRILDDFTETILKAIDFDTNNLFKLIQFGSKGKLEHMFNMVSAIGQKLINGERIKQKFGFKRTLPYFPPFDTSPESRGYITNSYLNGMNLHEYIFNAMAARFDLISKALSTSVTGEQNRKSIKNLESIIINNYRSANKNLNITQLVYGEDYLDPRRVERVKFHTVMISNSDMEKYKHPDFPEFYEKMLNDREMYRKNFLTIENMNVKEAMTDERLMPVHLERVIIDIVRGYENELKNEPSGPELKVLVSMVNELCENIPYILINEIQEKRKSKIPELIYTRML